MVHIYYDVPECPNCGSPRTGHYMRTPFGYPGLAEGKALENGEIVREVPSVPGRNCFCLECGFEWHSYVPWRLLTAKGIEEQKEKRGTRPMFDEYKDGKPPKLPLFKRILL